MIIDTIVAVLLLYAIVSGLRAGFILQAAQLLSVLLGVYVAYRFSYFVAIHISHLSTNTHPYTGIIAFGITFLMVVAAVIFVGRVLHKVVETLMMGWLNRLAGGIFAVCKILFLTSVACMILDSVKLVPQEQIDNSISYAFVLSFAPSVFSYLDISKLRNAI